MGRRTTPSKMPKTTGISRRVLFLLETQGSSQVDGLFTILSKLHNGMNKGTVRTLLKRHMGYGLVERVGDNYLLTAGGQRRVDWLKTQGFSFQSPV